MARNTNMREKVLALKNKGYSQNQAIRELKCSAATVSYHWSEELRKRFLNRNNKYKIDNHLKIKIKRFEYYSNKKYQKNQHIYKEKFNKRLQSKINKFKQIVKKHKGKTSMITIHEVRNLLEKNPYCYLTGRPINITETNSYQFDHKIPASRGGPATIENLGITCPEANRAKNDRTVEEHIAYCKEVLEHNGYTVTLK